MVVSSITAQYRANAKLTLERFSWKLVELLPGYTLSRQAVHHWENGKTHPDRNFLMLCAMRYGDWRRDWALDCLAAINPDLFAPVMAANRAD